MACTPLNDVGSGCLFNVSVRSGSVDTEGVEVVLEPCAAAIAAGDGRELWQLHQEVVLGWSFAPAARGLSSQPCGSRPRNHMGKALHCKA